MSTPRPVPFRLDVSESVLADLRDRLARTRLPDEPSLEPWSTGASVGYLRELLEYWRTTFDWRAAEARINAFRQFKVPLNGINVHYIHEEGKGPAPMPLLLSHGWPGSIVEFLDLIPMLTDPARFGGDPRDAFTVVAPSLPGYTLSFDANQPRLGVEEIVDTFAALMTDVLGYRKFAAQGGDWGGFVSSRMGFAYPDRLHGIHLNFLAAVRRDPAMLASTDPVEKKYAEELAYFLKEETGYQAIQGTKPQTLAFALTDSPSGLAAWIVEKFRTWTDNKGSIEEVVSRDVMLANITLYWVTGAIGSSFWPYYARAHRPWPIPEGGTINVPTGYIQFPREILRPPRSIASRMYTDIRRWTVADHGGHFAALEQPALLANEIRAFFRPLR